MVWELPLSVQHGLFEEVVYHVSQGCNVNEIDHNGLAPLHWAAWKGNYRIVKLLVEQGHADVDIRDHKNETPLHQACGTGRLALTKYLVGHCNADIDAKSDSGATALHQAAWYGHDSIVKYLIEKAQADVTAVDKVKRTPLHYAAINEQYSTMSYLVTHSPDGILMNAQDEYGSTSLHYAVIHGSLPIIQHLVEQAFADEGRTAMDMTPKPEVKEYLQRMMEDAERGPRMTKSAAFDPSKKKRHVLY